MICRQCQHECPEGSNFCPHCGRNFKPRSAPSKGAGTQEQSARPVADYPNQAYIDSHKSRRSTVRKTALTVSAIVLALGVGWGLVSDMILVTLGSPVLAVMIYSGLATFSAKDYYAVEGSRDADGNHRCVFCGNKGIHRKGEYKTDNTYANCSKCGAFLFQE